MSTPKTVLLFVLLFVLLLFALSMDEKLEPQAQSWISNSTTGVSDDNNMHYLLLGFHADQQANPVEMGKIVLEQYFQADAHAENYIAYEIPHKLELPDKPLCDLVSSDCLKEITATENYSLLWKNYEFLVQRYRQLANYSQLEWTGNFSFAYPLPSWKFMVFAQKLWLSQIWLEFFQGRYASAKRQLKESVYLTRHLLRNAGTLLGKMAAVKLLLTEIKFYALLLDQRESRESLLEMTDLFGNLSQAERNMEKVFITEFRGMAQTYLDIYENPGSFSDNFKVLPGWLLLPLYKPNASINQTWLFYKKLIARAKLDAKAWEKQKPIKLQAPEVLDYFRNAVGATLYYVGTADLEPYLQRMHDLQGLLVLARLKRELLLKALEPAKISEYLDGQSTFASPYGDTKIYWDKAGSYLYFKGPGKDTQQLRQLSIKPDLP